MKFFMKLIFILFYFCNFVVSDNFTPERGPKVTNIEGEAPARRHQRLNTQPARNVSYDFNSRQETYNPVSQHNNNRNIEWKENEFRDAQPLESRDSYRLPITNNLQLQDKNNDVLNKKSERGETIINNQENISFEDKNLKNQNIKLLNSNRRPVKLEDHLPVHHHYDTFVENKRFNDRKNIIMNADKSGIDYDFSADDINDENIFGVDHQNSRQQKPTRQIHTNPSGFRNQIRILSNRFSKNYNNNPLIVPIENVDHIFYLENEQHRPGSNIRSEESLFKQSSELVKKIPEETEKLYNVNNKAQYNNNDPIVPNENKDDVFYSGNQQYRLRPSIPSEELIYKQSNERVKKRPLEREEVRKIIHMGLQNQDKEMQIKSPQHSLMNEPKSESQNYEKFNDDIKNSKTDTSLIDADSLNIESNNPMYKYRVLREAQNLPLDTLKQSMVFEHSSYDTSKYDNLDTKFSTLQKYETKPMIADYENYDYRNFEEIYPGQKFNRKNLKEINLKNREEYRNTMMTTTEDTTLKKYINPEVNIFDYEEIFSEFYLDSDPLISTNNKDYVSIVGDHLKHNNTNVFNPSSLHGNKHIDTDLTLKSPIEDDNYKTREKLEKRNKRLLAVPNNEPLEKFPHSHASSKDVNHKIPHNDSDKRIEIDINYLPSRKHDPYINDDIIDTDTKYSVNQVKHYITQSPLEQGTDVIQILNKVNIQEHLKAFATKYIVVYPNETVEHVNEIDSVVAKFPNYVFIRSGNIIAGQGRIDLNVENDDYEQFHITATPLVKFVNKRLEPLHINDEAVSSEEEKEILDIDDFSSQFESRTEKTQPDVIPVRREKHTINLNKNTPLTVDLSGPIEEIDIKYFIDEEKPVTQTLTENVNKQHFISGTPYESDINSNVNGSNKKHASDSDRNAHQHKKNHVNNGKESDELVQSNIEITTKQPNHPKNNKHRSGTKDVISKLSPNAEQVSVDDNSTRLSFMDIIGGIGSGVINTYNKSDNTEYKLRSNISKNKNSSVITDVGNYAFNEKLKPEYQDTSTAKTRDSNKLNENDNMTDSPYTASDTLFVASGDLSSNSRGGIVSLISRLFHMFPNEESTENVTSNDGEILNKQYNHKTRGHSYKSTTPKNNFDNEVVTLSPIEVPENNGTLHNIHNKGYHHSKKRKHDHSGTDKNSNVVQDDLQLSFQPGVQDDTAQYNQGLDFSDQHRKSRKPEHHSRTGMENDSQSKYQHDDQITEAPNLTVEDDITSTVTSEDSIGKEKKRGYDNDDSIINQYSFQTNGQHNSEIGDVLSNQKPDYISQNYNVVSNFDDDQAITPSPIEVSQLPTNVQRVPQEQTNEQIMQKSHHHHHKSGHSHAHNPKDRQNGDNVGDVVTYTYNDEDIDLARIVAETKPLAWYRSSDGAGKNADTPFNLYVFQVEPIIARDTKTIIYDNGKTLKELTETIYKNKEDPYPAVIKTIEEIHPY